MWGSYSQVSTMSWLLPWCHSFIWWSCLNTRALKLFLPISIETGTWGFNTHVGQTNVCHQVRMSSRKVDSETRGSRQAPAIDTTIYLHVCCACDWSWEWMTHFLVAGRELHLSQWGSFRWCCKGRETGSEENCLDFRKEKSNEQERFKALNAFSVLLQGSDLEQIILLVKNFPPSMKVLQTFKA